MIGLLQMIFYFKKITKILKKIDTHLKYLPPLNDYIKLYRLITMLLTL